MNAALGAVFRDGLLSWAVLSRTGSGWAHAASGSAAGTTLREALQAADAYPRKLRPFVGLAWGKTELFGTQGESVRELTAAIRIDTQDRRRAICIAGDTSLRVACHAAQGDVLDVLDSWRACSIDPRAVEPLEIAWLRSAPEANGILNLQHSPAFLLAAGPGRIDRYPVHRSGEDDYQSIVLMIRRARNESGPIDRVTVIGRLPSDAAREEAGVRFEEFRVAGKASPIWSDAFALATAGFGLEMRREAARSARRKAAV